jgi:RsiW-degrading membrane proteinase PrsW (M82 family)
MVGLWILLILILISSLPVILVYLWFRLSRYPVSPLWFLFSLLVGAAALFPALFLQRFIFGMETGMVLSAGRWGLFVKIFIRVAFTEELSRLLVLLVFFRISDRLNRKTPDPAGYTAPISYGMVSYGAATGLLAGLGFAVLEGAAYGAADIGVALLRAFTAAPLHGACGSRVGAAALIFRAHPLQALFRFFSAVAIHGIYNFMIVMPGFPSVAAVILALSALASSILSIRSPGGGELHG